MPFLSSNKGKTYNLCHCKHRSESVIPLKAYTTPVWSNFEIADMNFWRGEAYTKFFEYLDSQGGFYYEVWTVSYPPISLACSRLNFAVSGGETRRCTASRRLCLREKTRSISLVILDMSIRRIRIVRRMRMRGGGDGVRATRRAVLVSFCFFFL